MRRLLPVVCVCMLLSCQDKVICPAFQSTYILDDSTRNAYFSYAWQLDEESRNAFLAGNIDSTFQDSTAVQQANGVDYYAYAGEKVVPWRVRPRTKYGIVKYEPVWLKKYRMRTAPMENVYSPEPEEKPIPNYVADIQVDSLSSDSLSLSTTDSLLAQDAAPVAQVEKEEGPKYLFKYDPNDNFNVEQEYYNKYFGEKLIDKRPTPEPMAPPQLDSLALASASDTVQRKGLPFKGLFKRKNKSDSTAIDNSAIDDTGR